MRVNTVDELRQLYAMPGGRALQKQLSALDAHGRRFIALSPFFVLATSGADGSLDASPRGGAPGFVQVTDDGMLLIADSPGNNRLDSLENLLANPHIGLLFVIPGIDETLRVNGTAELSTSADDIQRCTTERRAPKLVIRVTVREAYLHCAKAFMRSKLWDAQAQIDRDALPSMGQMINDQTGVQAAGEAQAEMVKRYQADL